MRIRTPIERAASTKPAAAIVLPEAVGCRKRNRRAAPASSNSSSGSSPSRSSASVAIGSSSSSAVASSADAGSSSSSPLFVASRLSSASAISSVSIPASASVWCSRSSVPAAVCGFGALSTRSRPSMSEYDTLQSLDGASAPPSISASASSRARLRALLSESAVVGSSPSWSSGSPAQDPTRSASAVKPSASANVAERCDVSFCMQAAHKRRGCQKERSTRRQGCVCSDRSISPLRMV